MRDALVHISEPSRTIPFSLDLTSNAVEAENLTDRLYEHAVKPEYGSRPGGQTEIQARQATKVALLNLFRAWRWDPDSPALSYSRDRTRYVGRRIGYRPLIKRVVPGFVKQGFVIAFDTEREAWANTPDDELECSKMIPTQELIELFAESLSLDMIIELEPSDVVICRAPSRRKRNSKGDFINIKPPVETPRTAGVTKQVKETTLLLRRFNRLVSQSFIGWFIPDRQLRLTNKVREQLRKVDREVRLITPYKSTLFRVFNNVRFDDEQLEFGGRFAGGWYQNASKADRHNRIWIDDAFGVEIDFSSMEPTIAYAMIKQHVVGDPYALDGLSEHENIRDKIKTILLVCLNVDGKRGATGAVRNALYKKFVKRLFDADSAAGIPKKGDLSDQALLWPESPPLDALIDQLFEKHHAILPSSKERGLKRMFLESCVAAEMLDRFTRKGSIILPVHDSFVVHPKHLQDLDYAMLDAIRKVIGVYANLTLESRTIERVYCPPGSWWTGPDDEALEPGQSTDRLYPWEVDQNDYSIFFDLWRATGRDVEAEMERVRALLALGENDNVREPESVG